MVADGMTLAIKELKSEFATTTTKTKMTPDDKKTPYDKAWKFWCFTYDANVSHNSGGHTGRRRDSAHDQHLGATNDDPQGANRTNEKFWLKWCHPVTYQAKDKPE